MTGVFNIATRKVGQREQVRPHFGNRKKQEHQETLSTCSSCSPVIVGLSDLVDSVEGQNMTLDSSALPSIDTCLNVLETIT